MADTYDILTHEEGLAAIGSGSTAANDDKIVPWITAVSRRLDDYAGPVVRRTITGELHDGGCHTIDLRSFPVTSITSITEYVSTTGTALTAESNSSKPASAYQTQTYSADATFLSPRIRRRASGGDALFATGRQNIAVTYVAGRYANAAAVDAKFKQAASIMLKNFWRSMQQSAAQVDEFDVPVASFPRFAIPNAVRDLLAGEIHPHAGIV